MSSPNRAGLVSLRRFAHLLDDVGLDPIIGLVPGLGDAAGAVLAAWIFVVAVRQGASRSTLSRIAANIALDLLIGAIPLLGDVFDFVWKANVKNVALLERHLAAPHQAASADRRFVTLLAGGMLALAIGLLVGGALLAAWLVRALAAA